MTYERTYGHYRRALKEVLADIQASVGGELWERRDDEYGWVLSVGESPNRIDVSLMMEDARDYDGEDGAGLGSFSMMIVEEGGQVLGQVTPYNYTADVWVRLTPKGYPELDHRLDIIRRADVAGLLGKRGT